MDVVKMLKNGTSFKFTTLLNIVKKKKVSFWSFSLSKRRHTYTMTSLTTEFSTIPNN